MIPTLSPPPLHNINGRWISSSKNSKDREPVQILVQTPLESTNFSLFSGGSELIWKYSEPIENNFFEGDMRQIRCSELHHSNHDTVVESTNALRIILILIPWHQAFLELLYIPIKLSNNHQYLPRNASSAPLRRVYIQNGRRELLISRRSRNMENARNITETHNYG